MSRGLGRVQRAVLDYLATDPMGRWAGGQGWAYKRSVVIAVAGDYSESADVSVRRAIRKLANAGLIEASYHQLRLAPTAAEHEAYEAGWQALVAAGKCSDLRIRPTFRNAYRPPRGQIAHLVLIPH